MSDKPTLRKKGKRSGRPPLMPSRVAESDGQEAMAKQLEKQLNRRQGLTTLDIIRIRMSKLGGATFRERAKWLIEREAKRKSFGANRVPTEKDNLPAVERWLRDPSASSYQAAMWPRRKRKKQIITD